EFYLERYPQLASDQAVVLVLILTEFRWRRRQQPEFSLEELHQRHPGLRDLLSAALQISSQLASLPPATVETRVTHSRESVLTDQPPRRNDGMQPADHDSEPEARTNIRPT